MFGRGLHPSRRARGIRGAFRVRAPDRAGYNRRVIDGRVAETYPRQTSVARQIGRRFDGGDRREWVAARARRLSGPDHPRGSARQRGKAPARRQARAAITGLYRRTCANLSVAPRTIRGFIATGPRGLYSKTSTSRYADLPVLRMGPLQLATLSSTRTTCFTSFARLPVILASDLRSRLRCCTSMLRTWSAR